MSLEYLAMTWLKFEKRCAFVLRERSPRIWNGRPDVIGVTDKRELLEIEIKRTMADFRANANKGHIRSRRDLILDTEIACPEWPRQFWFLVPERISDRVEQELPSYAGLLTQREPYNQIVCRVKAPVNKSHRRLSVRECVMLAKKLSYQVMNSERKIHQLLYPSVLTHEPEYSI